MKSPIRHLERKLRAKNAARRQEAARKQTPLPPEKQLERATARAKARMEQWQR